MTEQVVKAASSLPIKRWRWAVVSIILMMTSWASFGIGAWRASLVDPARWGTNIDIPETIAIDSAMANARFPFVLGSLVSAWLSLLSLMQAHAEVHIALFLMGLACCLMTLLAQGAVCFFSFMFL